MGTLRRLEAYPRLTRGPFASAFDSLAEPAVTAVSGADFRAVRSLGAARLG
jgi:hypothetical protein